MIYWFADFPNESAKFTYNEAQHRLDGELLLKIISEISQSSQFQPIAERETDKKCAFCAYRSYCARGIRAGDWQESENEPDPIPEIVFGNILEIEL
jgi:sulfatase maturation enzyme AslB (radical SAM superfamily)